MPVWSEICHVLTDILIYCSTQVLVCRRASANWWKWKYRRCQKSCSQSAWCKSTIFSCVENEGYIQLLWIVSQHLVPAALFFSCLRCGNVEEKVLLAAYFIFLTNSVINYHVRSWTDTALGEVVYVVCPEEWCEMLRKLGTRVSFVVLH